MKVSRAASVETLIRVFSDPEVEYVTVDQVYAVYGRELKEVEKNKKWLRVKLASPKKFGLVKTVSAGKWRGVVEGVVLTSEGRAALARRRQVGPAIFRRKRVASLEKIISDIIAYETVNPSVKVTLTIVTRENPVGLDVSEVK